MSDEPRCINCKATLRWERDGGEWKPNTYDSNVAIRCLDCASLLCGPCGKRHFEESGLLATSRAALAASQAEVSEEKSAHQGTREALESCVASENALRADVDRLTRERDMQVGYRDTRAMERDAAKDELATRRAEVAALRRSLAEADTTAASLERARLALRSIAQYDDGRRSETPCGLARIALAEIWHAPVACQHGDPDERPCDGCMYKFTPPTPIATPGTEETDVSKETERKLYELSQTAPLAIATELIGGIATSCASFIAEIDNDSRDVAAYLAQRLSPLINVAAVEIRTKQALEAIARDGRKLRAATPGTPTEEET